MNALTRIGCLAALGLLAATTASAAPSKATGGIRFTYTDASAQSVAWVGAYNSWNTSANLMKKGDAGVWTVVLPLPAGEQQYKFFVDGQYLADPENPVTGGDFGNSVVTVAANGDLVAAQATSNTAYNPKLFIGGRAIGLYQAIRDPATNRFGLRRPDMDLDFRFDVRMSELLKASFILNFESQAPEVELYRGRLNFDRGSLEFRQTKFQILGYDNTDVGSWDDPMHLVGNVGIYGHGYGFDRQGFKVNGQYLGFDGEVNYADNFEVGGNVYPVPTSNAYFALADLLRSEPDGAGGYRLVPNEFAADVLFLQSDANEDMLAAKVRREFGPWRVGALGRSDRGFNLGSINILETIGPNEVRGTLGSYEQEWYAGWR